MNNVIIGVVATIVSFLLFKRGGKPAVSLFILATAGIWIGFGAKLLETATAWQIGAGILWLVVLLAVLKFARENGKYVIPFMLIALIAIGGVAYAAPKNVADTNQQPAATTAPAVDSNDPNAEWAQWSADRSDNRLISAGIDAESPEKALENKLALAKHDAVSLTAYAYQAGLIPADQTQIKTYLTEDGKYLNEAGKALWYQLKGNYAGTTNTFAATPSGTVNSGTDGTSFYTAQTNGITGDTKTLVTTYPNGNKTETLTRCGNPVFAGFTSLPTGKTDNPTPAPSPTPAPDNPLEPKDASQDVGVNPAVAPWKQDDIASGNEPGHTVSNEDGATVSNGYQADPVQDATNAANNAAAAAADQTATHNAAVDNAVNSGGGVVDNNQSHTVSTNPATSDPNW